MCLNNSIKKIDFSHIMYYTKELQIKQEVYMRKILVLACALCFLGMSAFAQEEGALEIETGVEVVFITGYYDSDGEFQEGSGDPMVITIPISVFYEFFTGFEAGAKLWYSIYNEDAGDTSGLPQPAIGVKYTSDFGLGAYVDVFLPFGTEDIVGTDPEMYLDIAIFYDGAFDSLLLYGEILYRLTFAGEDDTTADQIVVKVEPGYQVMDSLKVYLGAQLSYALGISSGGTAIDDSSAYVFGLYPGVEYKIMDNLTVGADVPFTLFGASSQAESMGIPLNIAPSTWAVRLKVILNLL